MSTTAKIREVLQAAIEPITARDILDRLPEGVTAAAVHTRLGQEVQAGRVEKLEHPGRPNTYLLIPGAGMRKGLRRKIEPAATAPAGAATPAASAERPAAPPPKSTEEDRGEIRELVERAASVGAAKALGGMMGFPGGPAASMGAATVVAAPARRGEATIDDFALAALQGFLADGKMGWDRLASVVWDAAELCWAERERRRSAATAAVVTGEGA